MARVLALFVQHPGITRGLAFGELGLGMWLAEKQKPVAADFIDELREPRRSDRLTADIGSELAGAQSIKELRDEITTSH